MDRRTSRDKWERKRVAFHEGQTKVAVVVVAAAAAVGGGGEGVLSTERGIDFVSSFFSHLLGSR